MPAAVATSTLLVVEDDDSIRETVGEVLRAEGYDVLTCGDGAEALNLFTSEPAQQVDLLVLDLMLPGLGGLDLCRELRRINNNTPILVISARDSETDRVLGLEVGADDYLVKPFGLRELVARCRALLRRAQQDPSVLPEIYSHANLASSTSAASPVRERPHPPRSTRSWSSSFSTRTARSRDQLLEKIWELISSAIPKPWTFTSAGCGEDRGAAVFP